MHVSHGSVCVGLRVHVLRFFCGLNLEEEHFNGVAMAPPCGSFFANRNASDGGLCGVRGVTAADLHDLRIVYHRRRKLSVLARVSLFGVRRFPC